MLLQRYLNGHHADVWNMLLASGDTVRRTPLHTDALAVVDETMRRVRHNIKILVDRLAASQYQFGVYPDGTPFDAYAGPLVPPHPDIHSHIDHIEAQIGPVPLALRCFWEIVGEVNFIGRHPHWPQFADPLVLFSPGYVLTEYAEWHLLRQEEGADAVGPFAISLAPDILHKDNVSGGEPYRMLVPNSSVDGILIGEQHQTTLVNYLRVCFQAGGFPGVRYATGSMPEPFHNLAQGLLAL